MGFSRWNRNRNHYLKPLASIVVSFSQCAILPRIQIPLDYRHRLLLVCGTHRHRAPEGVPR
jgi:hypothetical protein